MVYKGYRGGPAFSKGDPAFSRGGGQGFFFFCNFGKGP